MRSALGPLGGPQWYREGCEYGGNFTAQAPQTFHNQRSAGGAKLCSADETLKSLKEGLTTGLQVHALRPAVARHPHRAFLHPLLRLFPRRRRCLGADACVRQLVLVPHAHAPTHQVRDRGERDYGPMPDTSLSF